MNGINFSKDKMVRFGTAFIMAGTIILLSTVPARALLFENLHGNAQVYGLRSDSPDGRSKSLGLDYTVNWSKSLISYLGARASLRYYNLGVNETIGAHTWRREFQPAGELFWNHPLFTINGGLRHQKSTSNDATANLIQNTSTVSLATKALNYPILKFRYEWNRSYNESGGNVIDTLDDELSTRNERDTKSRLWQASLNYSKRNNDFYYSISRGRNDNFITGLKIIDLKHQFRWYQSGIKIGENFRFNSAYNFIYRSQETNRPPGAAVYRQTPFIASLYAYDPTPEVGELDTLPALADGITATPTTPTIDIGRAFLDQNIGVDFGFAREISALYIYTDRPSGSELGWKIYVSSDNLVWNMIDGNISSIFNTGFSRYEIEFPSQLARYIKAVNFGTNDVPEALVTEIEAWELFVESARENRHQASHFINIGSAYSFSKKLQSAADLSYRLEPGGEFSDSRNQISYNISLLHNPKAGLSQNVRFQGGTESFKTADLRNTNTNLSYNLKLNPIKTLEFSFAAQSRSNYINRVKIQEANNLFFLTKAVLLEALTISGDAGYGRNNVFESDNYFDVWTYHLSADGAVLPSLDAIFSFAYQSTFNPKTDNIHILRQYRLGANYRMTQSIYFTGALAANYETKTVFMSQDYSLSWNLSEKLSLGGGYSLNDSRNGIRYERSNIQINFSISPRTRAFASYSDSNTPVEGEGRISFVQAGLNTGF
jgi:hypothetical protein